MDKLSSLFIKPYGRYFSFITLKILLCRFKTQYTFKTSKSIENQMIY